MVKASRILSSLFLGSGLAAAARGYAARVEGGIGAGGQELTRKSNDLTKDGFITNIFEWLLTPVLGGNQLLAWGLGSLAEVAFKSAIPCLGEVFSGTSQTCLWHVLDAAIGDWDSLFEPTSGRRKRDGSGSYTASIPYNLPNGTVAHMTVIHTQIIPLSPGSSNMYTTLAARPNASSWAHAYTRQYGNTTPIRIFHRRINDAEEGDDAGLVNQIRAGATWNPNMLTKRVEEDDDGVVLDYLWKDSSVGAWDLYHDDSPVDTTASDSATIVQEFMSDNNAIATCATPVIVADDGGLLQATAGVAAFGWNNQPFGFDGRSSGWLSGCAVDGE
ncbi:hypothetical protein C8F04DRAFT_1125489 [Mycena alexandri]|uniref:Uncharacterized protein n=1 Tax=Mycena alexandri TaxID=1745969 RepID=A0AAD6SJ03_9AGAR|nr:hypothetical protein C8F04DRAFT_1125489 [Mycena alexandri]